MIRKRNSENIQKTFRKHSEKRECSENSKVRTSKEENKSQSHWSCNDVDFFLQCFPLLVWYALDSRHPTFPSDPSLKLSRSIDLVLLPFLVWENRVAYLENY